MFSLAKEAEDCSMLDKPNGPLKLGLRNICLKIKDDGKKKKKKKKKEKKIDTSLYKHFRRAGHS